MRRTYSSRYSFHDLLELTGTVVAQGEDDAIVDDDLLIRALHLIDMVGDALGAHAIHQRVSVALVFRARSAERVRQPRDASVLAVVGLECRSGGLNGEISWVALELELLAVQYDKAAVVGVLRCKP